MMFPFDMTRTPEPPSIPNMPRLMGFDVDQLQTIAKLFYELSGERVQDLKPREIELIFKTALRCGGVKK